MPSLRRSIIASILFLVHAAMAAAPDAGVPALAVRAPNGATNLLIGTLHVPYEGLRQPAPSILDGAKHLVIESATTQGPQPAADVEVAPEVMAGKAARAAWAEGLSDGQVAGLRRNLDCHPPMSANLVDLLLVLKSPRAAAAFAYARCGQPGQDSRDDLLAAAARIRGVPTVTLETQVAVERQRKAVPDRIYARQLQHAFTADTMRAFEQVVAALNRGDYASVLDLAVGHDMPPSDALLFRRLMVSERNRAWMPPLRRYLDEGGAVVLVGAAHLPGPDGLLSLLQAAGYAVEPVVVPEDPR
ncbi:TraB/GumN family protein [Cupriavidus basilensis]|uniref:TraB/GumN family protein n=1 Tax=Cupriavidus basilensis TaxID=68895 RepID=UPI00157AADF3|nr:TraB/GumN family protein [Cupriavidus basilensis]NUA26637.1 TraB/GumN family protein [Cupriavidus basilensis]